MSDQPTVTAADYAVAEEVIGAWVLAGNKRRRRDLIAEGAARARNNDAAKQLVASLKEMVKCYGDMDGIGTPIQIIAKAVSAIRLVEPNFKFEKY